jgi:hypothetical protein
MLLKKMEKYSGLKLSCCEHAGKSEQACSGSQFTPGFTAASYNESIVQGRKTDLTHALLLQLQKFEK